MKRLLLIFTGCFCLTMLWAQNPKIKNTRLSLSPNTDSLIVTYDLTGKAPVLNVYLEVADSLGNIIPAKTVTGDIGNNIIPGIDKTIYWNMTADKAYVYGKQLNVNVNASILQIHSTINKNKYFPWLYVASGISAATGTLAWLKANSLYDKYPSSSQTAEAEQYRSDIQQMATVRNAAYIAAGILGTTGVILHIRHKRAQKAIKISYYPVIEGATFALTYNF